MPLPYTTEQNVIKIVNEKLKDQPIDKDAIVSVVNEAIESGEIDVGGDVEANPSGYYSDDHNSLKTINIDNSIYQPDVGFEALEGDGFEFSVDENSTIIFPLVLKTTNSFTGFYQPYRALINSINLFIDLANSTIGTTVPHITKISGNSLYANINSINPNYVMPFMARIYISIQDYFKNFGVLRIIDPVIGAIYCPILSIGYTIDSSTQMFTSFKFRYYDLNGTLQEKELTNYSGFTCNGKTGVDGEIGDVALLTLENNYKSHG